MATEAATRWEALLSGLNPDRSAREILFDPLVEDWAFAGVSDEYRDLVRQKEHSDQERALLVDRLRWIVQKRLAGRGQEVMLMFLAGYSQVEIADSLRLSRSTVRRTLLEAGGKLKAIVGATDCLSKSHRSGDCQIRILPLDSEDDFKDFAVFVAGHEVRHVALGTFADIREALVIFSDRALTRR
jgi:DNA-binding CsgD family transcriptional regulator